MYQPMNPQDPNQDLGQTVPYQPGDQDPGFFQRLQSNGVLGMPLGEALLRFGSGVLSGSNIQEGLSRGGASLVQGSQQARSQQSQDARFNQGLKMQDRRLQQSQEAQAAAQNRQDAASRRTQATALMREGLGPELAQAVAAGTATPEQQAQAATLLQAAQTRATQGTTTPYQRGTDVFRDPQTGAHYREVFDARAGTQTLVPVGGGTPLAGEALAAVQPRLVRAPQEVTTGQQKTEETNVVRYNEVLRLGSAARDTLAEVDTARTLLNPGSNGTVATGSDLPARAIRELVRLTGIPVGENTPTRLEAVTSILGGLNAEQRGRLLAGLAPVSNAEYLGAERALATAGNSVETLNLLLGLQRQALVRQIETSRELGATTPQELSQRQLTVDGWLERRNSQRAFDPSQNQSRLSNVPNPSGGATGVQPQAPQITVGPNGVRSVPNPPPPGAPNPSAPPPSSQAPPRGTPSPVQGGPLYSPDFGQNPVPGQRGLPWQ